MGNHAGVIAAGWVLFGVVGGAQALASPGAPKEIIRRQCGACHDPRSGTANPQALKIFDLGREDWMEMMSDRQMDHAIGRLRERQSLKPHEIAELLPKGATVPPVPTREEVDRVQAAFALTKVERDAR